MNRRAGQGLRLLCLVLAGALVYLLADVWLGGRPLLLAGVLAGGLAALCADSARASAWAGGAAGAAGAAAALLYADPAATTYRVTHLPDIALADAPTSFFGGYVTQVVQYHPLNIYFADPLGRLAYVLAAAVLTAVAALVWERLLRTPPLAGRRGPALLVAVLVVAFGLTAWTQTQTLRSRIAERPEPGTYEYDAHVYLATYYEMGEGLDYYRALLAAASGDKRVIAENGVVDGRFRTWGTPPVVVREPWAFRLWRLVPGGATGVLALAVAIEAALLAGLWWAFEPYLGRRAPLVPMLLVPLSLARLVTMNVFMPDHWAAVALLACLVALMRERFAAAAAFALAAALFRETAALWLAVFAAVCAWLWLRRLEGWGRRAAAAAGALAVFAAAFAVHYRAAAAIGVPPPGGSKSLLTIAVQAYARPLSERFVAPASYLMYAYGFYVLPAWAFLALQVPGLAVALRPRPAVRTVVLAFALLWPAFTLTAGANSSYWGELYVPFAVAGSAALLALGLPAAAPSATILTDGEATEEA